MVINHYRCLRLRLTPFVVITVINHLCVQYKKIGKKYIMADFIFTKYHTLDHTVTTFFIKYIKYAL